MNERRWTQAELISMPRQDFEFLSVHIAARAWRLLGIRWSSWWTLEREPATGDLVLRYA